MTSKYIAQVPAVLDAWRVKRRDRRMKDHLEEGDAEAGAHGDPIGVDAPVVPDDGPQRPSGDLTEVDEQPVGVGVALKALVIAVILVAAVIPVRRQLSSFRIEHKLSRYPVNAVEWIEIYEPPGPMYNDYNWGGYLIWALPSYPVALDGRAEIHLDMLEELRKGQVRQVFDRERFRLVVTSSLSPLVNLPRVEPAWTVAYRDPIATVLTRSEYL